MLAKSMERMSVSILKVDMMTNQDEIKNRLRAIEQEIIQGWTIYGRFMDAGRTLEPDAMEVREVLRKLAEEKSKLLMMVEPHAVKEFIDKHRELLNEG